MHVIAMPDEHGTHGSLHGFDSTHIPHAVITRVVVHRETPLRAWREHLGLTREDLASRLGVALRVIDAWENPATPPRRSALVHLAAALGIDVARLDI